VHELSSFHSDFCKQLSKKEALGEASSESEGEDHHSSGSDAERPFHHPFQIKERPSSIVMNIRVSLPLQKPTSDVPVMDGGNVFRWLTKAMVHEAKVLGILLRDAWHWDGNGSATNDPFAAPGYPPLYLCPSLISGSTCYLWEC
jgi:hypothetical protein